MPNIMHNSEHSLDCFILKENPITCGMCSARTSFDVLVDGSQLHQGLSIACDYKFVAVEDAQAEQG